jgi:hypothetical protein
VEEVMSRDKLQGLLIGLGAGVLVGAFMKVSEETAQHAAESIDAEHEPASAAPVVVTARAADA